MQTFKEPSVNFYPVLVFSIKFFKKSCVCEIEPQNSLCGLKREDFSPSSFYTTLSLTISLVTASPSITSERQ